jgi:hypothetical protein
MTDEPKRRGRPPKAADPIALPATSEPAPGTFACKVLRDYWPEEDVRVRAGAVIHVDAATAMDGVEAGILSRVR